MIDKLYKIIKEVKIAGYKNTLQWAKEKDRPQIDIEVLENKIGAYQDVLNVINELKAEKIDV